MTFPHAPIPHIDSSMLNSLVSMADAIQELRDAFSRPLSHVERIAIEVGNADLLVMPAVYEGFAGVKSIVVQPANAGTDLPVIGGSYVLLDTNRACAVATFDGGALTKLRTPAISAIAIDLLAPPNAQRAAIIGQGPQAVGHLDAVGVVMPGVTAQLIGRNRSIEDTRFLKTADIVVTCTSSPVPVIDASQIRHDATVVAVGSYRPDRAELAADVIVGADVWVDDRGACRAEAGDLYLAHAQGWSWESINGTLHELIVRGQPTSDSHRGTAPRSVFKSVGLAAQDLVIARLAYSRLAA